MLFAYLTLKEPELQHNSEFRFIYLFGFKFLSPNLRDVEGGLDDRPRNIIIGESILKHWDLLSESLRKVQTLVPAKHFPQPLCLLIVGRHQKNFFLFHPSLF